MTTTTSPDPRTMLAKKRAEKLRAEGRHVDAAEELRRAGLALEAGTLFESLFEFGRALQCYEHAGDVTSAMRVALRAEIPGAVDRIVAEAVRAGQADALVRMLSDAHRSDALAKVFVASGRLEEAARAYQDAGDVARAAEMKESLGDLRGAGVLYEQALVDAPGDTDVSLRLGRILSRFSRHDEAVALLQRAIRDAPARDDVYRRAAPTLILSFLELGYPAAAASIFTRWQTLGGDDAPAREDTLASFLTSPRATALAATMVGAVRAAESTRAIAPDPFFDDVGQGEAQSETAERALLDEGTVLLAGRYLLGEPLGGGGVGQVFRAYDALLDQPVAVKIFGGQALASDAVHAFAREARAAASLHLPIILPIVELNMSLGYISTVFTDAPTVEERLREGGSSSWIAPFARALLDGLAAVHRIGLVHGALKPTNLFLPPGSVRVADFGAHHMLALRSTETGGLASAWPYLAPEQLFGAAPDVSADLYAVAAILYRALVGRAPFSSVDGDRAALPPPPSTYHPRLRAFDAFFARALSPQIEGRFTDALVMKEAMPDVPYEFTCAPSAPDTTRATVSIDLSTSGRYLPGPLVYRDPGHAKVYEGSDTLLERSVWIVEAESDVALLALMACASLGRGAQPIYDVIAERRHVVIARDAFARATRLEGLRGVPQGLFRDLSSLAAALEALHDQGYALGGIDRERALGPVGPRLRLAPASVPRVIDDTLRAADLRTFARFVGDMLELPEEVSEPVPDDVLHALLDRQLLSRSDAEELRHELANARWSRVASAIASRLVLSAQKRVIAQLAVQVLKGEG